MNEQVKGAAASPRGMVERASELADMLEEDACRQHAVAANAKIQMPPISESLAAQAAELLRELADEVEELQQEEACRLCGRRGGEVIADCSFISVHRCLARQRGLGAPPAANAAEPLA